MLNINYKAVYELRDKVTPCLSSLIITNRWESDKKSEEQFEAYRSSIEKYIGTDDFEISNICCMAEGIHNHVYTPNKGIIKDLGKRKCIFCGLDDFSI